MSDQLIAALKSFAAANKFAGKGPLSLALVVTDHARLRGLPLVEAGLITEGGGQVQGLGMAQVQAILARHSIDRILAKEGGRTSRGSMGKMRLYVEFLNSFTPPLGPDAVKAIEKFWIEQVRAFFAGKPMAFRFDPARSVRAFVRDLLSQAEQRQREAPGSTVAGSVLQHLVGAKLEFCLGAGKVAHESASTNDESTQRSGDFEIADAAIHVTTAPSEALLHKCARNLEAGLRPLIVTTWEGVAQAEINAKQAGIADRIDVLDIEQWVASNIFEWTRYAGDARRAKVSELVACYNDIVRKFETDPSLLIEEGKSPRKF